MVSIPTTAMPIQPPSPSQSFQIPWKCLDDSGSEKIAPNKPLNSIPKAQKSFAQAVANICDTPSSQLPKPTIKGDRFSISIPDEEYDMGLDGCKNNLHARIIWPKGSSPLNVVALREKLKPVWKNLAPWGVTSIGRGFYEFVFSSIEDARRVRSVGSWILNPGLLKFFPWTKDFSSTLQTNTYAQVWLKIHGLSQEYWRKKIIFAIASSVGTPICVDSVTSKPAIERTFGHFARVLIDIDLSKELRYEVLVERKGYAFFVEFEYENLPDFCGYCQAVGHHVNVCRKANKQHMDSKTQAGNNGIKIDKNKGKEPLGKQENVWVPKATAVVDLTTETDKQPAQQLETIKANDAAKIDAPNEQSQPAEAGSVSKSPVIELEQQDGKQTEEDMDDDSSQASEFVDATQLNNEDSDDQSNHEQDSPSSTQKKVYFLNQSWANLEDTDEDLIRKQEAALIASLEEDIDEQVHQEDLNNTEASGFKLVTHRKKKTQKAIPSKASTSHLTRSKVPSKPFK